MRIHRALCTAVFLIFGASAAFAQELTTEQVLAKLDEKAKVFSSLEASIAKEEVILETKQTPEKGKVYLKTTKNGPYVFLDLSEPKSKATKALVKDGNGTVYFASSNSYQSKKVDPKSDLLQLLLIGFGVPSSTLKKFYTPKVTGRETIDGVRAVVLELPSTSTTSNIEKVTLWLDPNTWIPVQTRTTEKSKDYFNFRYSNVKLNKGVSDSVFKLDVPKSAKPQ